ncbi:MAG: hypothetical protein GX914_06320 [Erysipelotrichia bacterium]|nr:hypothetical protein [Erysipelotrichia bacterium]
MISALTFKELNKKIQKRYDYGEQRVVGIILARYDIDVTKRMIEQCYNYWHLNSKKYFDIFWAGYGEYLAPNEESSTKIILKYLENKNNAYFDLKAFIEFKEQFNMHFKKTPYEDRIVLALINYRNGKLHFDESIKIDLEENIDNNYAKIRKIIEFITMECRYQHQVEPIAKKILLDRFKNFIKGITISEIINLIVSAK